VTKSRTIVAIFKRNLSFSLFMLFLFYLNFLAA
jgi:hypothetical protein